MIVTINGVKWIIRLHNSKKKIKDRSPISDKLPIKIYLYTIMNKQSITFLKNNHPYPNKINKPEKLEGWFTPNNKVLLHKYLKKYADTFRLYFFEYFNLLKNIN